ncbi:hypothetical protein LguiB_001567 [Lonicera macranthoides]
MKKLWSSKAELNKPDAKNGLVESGVPTNENKSSGSPSTEKQKHHYLRGVRYKGTYGFPNSYEVSLLKGGIAAINETNSLRASKFSHFEVRFGLRKSFATVVTSMIDHGRP